MIYDIDWHYSLGDQRFGPVAESWLRHAVATGALPRNLLVWNPELADWVDASKLREFEPSDSTVDEKASQRVLSHYTMQLGVALSWVARPRAQAPRA